MEQPGIMNSQAAAYLRNLEKKIDQLSGAVETMKLQSGAGVALPGQYAGKCMPSIEGCEITMAAATTRVQGNITLAADGPFIARAIHFAWRPTAGALLGKWRPIASSDLQDDSGLTHDTIDFYWEYAVTGSRRNRQNIPVPSALLRQAEQGNGYWDLPTEDAFSATATITVWVAPTVPPEHTGVMYVGFSGYYVLE
jgi:hypothetical protein